MATLKKAKGETPYGQSRREKAAPSASAAEGTPGLHDALAHVLCSALIWAMGIENTALRASVRCAAGAEPRKKEFDYRDEKLHWEGPPHRGDLAINVVMGTTLLWLPLTAAAVGRAAFLNYRFTDRRLSVSTTAPWKSAPPPLSQ